MVAHVLRLRIDLLLGGLRGGGRHATRTLVGLGVLVLAVAVAFIAVLTLQSADEDVATAVLVTAGSALTVGFALAPVVAGSVDPVDPRRFRIFAPAPAALAGALLAALPISVPVLALTALAVAVAISWTALGVAPALAIGAAVVAVLTCGLAARTAMAAASLVLRDRRPRELTGVFAVVVLVVVLPVCVFLASLEWRGEVPEALRTAADVLAVTPFGAVWALPTRVAVGDPGGVWSAVVAIATLVLLVTAWFAVVRRLVTSIDPPRTLRDRSTLGWFGVAPGTQAGVIAARSLVYWFRDRRYVANVVVVPVAAALTVVPLVIAGVPLAVAVLVPVPIMALFFGWLPHNDLAYDSTAVWLHLASGVRGTADRIGRLVPPILIAVPILAVVIPVAVAIRGEWTIAPAVVGLSACLLFAGLGLSSIASVAAPYAVSRPGESPFQQPQRVGSGSAMSQAAVFFGAIVLSAPVAWWAWVALDQPWFSLVALGAGLVIGGAVLVAGVLIGAGLFERGGSRLMEFAETT